MNIIRTEWLKIKYYKPFWVLFWLYPVCLGAVVGAIYKSQVYAQEMLQKANMPPASADHLALGYPHVWQSVAYAASWLHFIPALLLILNVTNEFTFRSHRQNLLEGWSRAQWLGAKLSLAGALSAYCTANVLVFTLIGGIASGSDPTVENSQFVVIFLLQSFFYAVFALFSAFLIRRPALALAAFLMYSTLLEGVLRFFANLSFRGLGNFLPLNVVNSLLPFPYLKEAPKAAQELLAMPEQQVLLGVTALYLLLFLGLMGYRFCHEDL